MEQTQTTTVQPALGSVQANIEGAISGQVAVGNYILQIGAISGGVVNFQAAGQKPHRQARSSPVQVLPQRFAGFLDRVEEVQAAATALTSAEQVEFHAPGGLGKTSLLRVLARHAMTQAFPDGVIYLSARDQAPGDLLQSIFDALYEYNAPYKPSQGEIRSALQGRRLLILLDDVELSREEVESLFDAAPDCTFLLASSERKLYGGGRSIDLPGLPPQEGRLLVARELGRPLTPEESAAVDKLCMVLGGSPLAILQAAALARDRNVPLERLAEAVAGREPEKKMAGILLSWLSEPEKQVVAAMAALNGAPLRLVHSAAITGLSPTDPWLEDLQQRGAIQVSGSGFALAGTLSGLIQESWDLSAWQEAMLRYFLSWAEIRLDHPQQILEDSQAILNLIASAGKNGRWEGALRLVKAVEGALAIGKRWEAWEKTLEAGLRAADSLGDLKEKAWVLHQLGTRALCLGEKVTARSFLVRALRLRESLGDRAGAAVTRHNLSLILPAPSNPGDSSLNSQAKPGTKLPRPSRLIPTKFFASGILLALSFLAIVVFYRPSPTSPALTTATGTVLNLPVPDTTSEPSGSFLDTEPAPTPTTHVTPAVTPTLIDTPSPQITTEPADLQPPTNGPATPASCTPIVGWPTYTVRTGDTLVGIAQATGSTFQVLARANCLRDPHKIKSGQVLSVPRPLVLIEAVTSTITLTVPPPRYPDLMVSLELGIVSQNKYSLGYLLPYTLLVENRGEEKAGPFEVSLYTREVFEGSGWAESGQGGVGPLSLPVEEPLEPGAKLSIENYLPVTADPSALAVEVWAVADESDQVKESDETNNRSNLERVDLPNHPPVAWIKTPGEPLTLYTGSYDKKRGLLYVDLAVYGGADDPEQGALDGQSLAWTSDRTEINPGVLGSGSSPSIRLYADRCQGVTHTLTLTATDARGATGSASVPVTVAGENCRPKITLISPKGDKYPVQGKETENLYFVEIAGEVQVVDYLGRPVASDAIRWTTDQIDVQKSYLGSGEKVGLILYMPNTEICDRIVHTVSVLATDPEGNQAQKDVPVEIFEYCPQQ